jgi:hypothetical protein
MGWLIQYAPMKRVILLVASALVVAGLASSFRRNTIAQTKGDEPRARTAFRVTFGERQERETDYTGTLSLSEGRLIELVPWRFFGEDKLEGTSGWSVITRRAIMETHPDQPRPIATAGQTQSVVPKGVSAIVDAPATANATIQTRRATYTFRLADLTHGHLRVFEDGDVSVQAVPAPSRVSPQGLPKPTEEHDYPSLAIAGNGSAWVAWQAYQNSGDRVLVAHSTATGWSDAEPLTPAGQDIFHTSIAEDSRGRVWVVWSQREGEAWNLVARVRDASGWGAARKLTSRDGPNFFHKLVRDRKGNLHLVWVAHQDATSHIMWSKLDGERWSAPQEISGANAWMPDAVCDSRGDLYVAWDSYRAGNYDIFLRHIGADGVLGPIEQVTKSSRFQAHASVAVDGNDRVWLAWDEGGSNWGKDYARDDTWRGTPLYADRRPRLAILENGKWLAPVAEPMAAIPDRYARFVEQPKLACDGAGRIWMSLEVRTSTAMNRTDFWANNGRWDMFLTAYEGDHWRPAAPVPRSSTRPEGAFHISGGPSGVWAIWANDNRPFPAAGAGNRGGYHDVEFARMDGESTPRAPVLQAFTEPPANAAFIHPHENADVQRVRAYRIQNAGSELRILRGDFHRHTEMSNDGAGDGSLEDYFRYMIDAAQMDTGIVSDHQEGGEEYTWWRTEKSIDLFHIPAGLTPLFGYERSVPYPNGHRNVVFPQRGVRVLNISAEELKGTVQSGPILYPYLKQNRGVCMLHSLATDQGSDYRDNDPEVEPLVEIYQGYHANYEYAGAPRAESSEYNVMTHGPYRPAGFYWNGLAKGYKLGIESSSDHVSTHSSYTMIYAPSTARLDIVESMRKRHTYGATDNIVLDFRVRDGQGHEWMMGDAVDVTAMPVMHVKVLGTSDLASVEIIKDGKFVYKTEPDATTAEFDYRDTTAVAGQSWYYVRVIQKDRNLAWSSPIWITYRGR